MTQQLRVEEKRAGGSRRRNAELGRTSKGVFDQLVSFRNPLTSERLGAHLDRNDIDNLLALRLSETKAALLERHLASCDECLDLLLLTLEERTSSRGCRAALKKLHAAKSRIGLYRFRDGPRSGPSARAVIGSRRRSHLPLRRS